MLCKNTSTVIKHESGVEFNTKPSVDKTCETFSELTSPNHWQCIFLEEQQQPFLGGHKRPKGHIDSRPPFQVR